MCSKLAAVSCTSQSGLAGRHSLQKHPSPCLLLLADTGMFDFRRKCGRLWAPLAFLCSFCASSVRHWCSYRCTCHAAYIYVFFWQDPSVKHFRLSQGLCSTCHENGFSLMKLKVRDKNLNWNTSWSVVIISVKELESHAVCQGMTPAEHLGCRNSTRESTALLLQERNF